MNLLHTLFVAPFEFAFMRDGLIIVLMIGVTASVLSCLLVVRRQALMGDAISHCVLLGVALGWVVAREHGVLWGAMLAGVLSGTAITLIERSGIKLDAAMGIVLTTAFALGLAIISVVKPTGIDLFHVLLGNVLGVTEADLTRTAIGCALVLAVVAVLFRGLQFWSFDPVAAQVAGLPVRLLHYVFTGLLSATVVVSIQAVGVLLVVAMLVTPGAHRLAAGAQARADDGRGGDRGRCKRRGRFVRLLSPGRGLRPFHRPVRERAVPAGHDVRAAPRHPVAALGARAGTPRGHR